MEDKQMYVGQKALIEKDGKVLVVFDPQLGIDFPGGKIQEGETDFVQSLKREVREETSLEITVGEPFYTWYFKTSKKHRNNGKEIYAIAFRCTYVSGAVKLSDEHNKYKWYDRSDYHELKEDSGYYKALEKYFSENKL